MLFNINKGAYNGGQLKLTDDGYVTHDGCNKYSEFKVLDHYGLWMIFKFRGDGAFYSFHPNCGFYHVNYYTTKDGIFYNKEKEFSYCPNCGKNMLLPKNRKKIRLDRNKSKNKRN